MDGGWYEDEWRDETKGSASTAPAEKVGDAPFCSPFSVSNFKETSTCWTVREIILELNRGAGTGGTGDEDVERPYGWQEMSSTEIEVTTC